jgi:hypothetical protein
VENQIDNNYKYDDVILDITSDTHGIKLEVIKNGIVLYTHSIDRKYIYAKLSAWADGQDYRIKCIVKRTPKY